ncbi:YycC family protein [Cytobacillus sp.]|uniref:YycC family protein n=1 Tax=Cytobacillus sp. TaxID=2675269 RepID=UPI0028BE7F9E|nr:YycC family protein [Cytobacillus sp.]
MKPLQISAETAKALAEKLKLPIEQIMHMPQHILIQKMMELEKKSNQTERL